LEIIPGTGVILSDFIFKEGQGGSQGGGGEMGENSPPFLEKMAQTEKII